MRPQINTQGFKKRTRRKRMNTFEIHLGDCLNGMKSLPNNSVDLCLTDPPYFIDGLDEKWELDKISKRLDNKKGTIKSLPKGMKYDRQQGYNFEKYYLEISKEIYRILKPGGFFLSWSAPRLYHRLAVAVEDAGFEIRDMYSWLYTQNQMKAMGLKHFINKKLTKGEISKEEAQNLTENINGWKTPQVKSCFEPICFAQKPTEGTYLDNWNKYGVGLVNMNIHIGENKAPANIVMDEEEVEEIFSVLSSAFLVNKPNKKEKGNSNIHLSVKPQLLCQYFIRLLTKNGATVLDPFSGSGTTGVAALLSCRNYIGYEKNREYYDISLNRLVDARHTSSSTKCKIGRHKSSKKYSHKIEVYSI